MKRLPPVETWNRNVEDLRVIPVDNYRVAEWTPERDGQDTPTQVHLVLELKDAPFNLALRLKSRDACDTLIEALTRHRLSVWPEGKA